MTEIVYSAQNGGFEKGRHYENPRWFEKITPGCTFAYVIGHWPKVTAALKLAEIDFVELQPGAPVSWKDGLAPAGEGVKGELIEIDPNFKRWGAERVLHLARALAQRQDVVTKKEAYRIIEDEMDRRAKIEAGEDPDADDEE